MPCPVSSSSHPINPLQNRFTPESIAMSQPVPSTDSAFVQRENSLLLWSALLRAKPQAELGLYQGTTVSGVLCSTNAGLDGFVLRDMQSPFGTYKAAEIRSQDVRHIQIDRW